MRKLSLIYRECGLLTNVFIVAGFGANRRFLAFVTIGDRDY